MYGSWPPSRWQRELAAGIAVLAVAMFAYQALRGAGLGQTSAFYIGVPAIIAIGIVPAVASRSVATP